MGDTPNPSLSVQQTSGDSALRTTAAKEGKLSMFALARIKRMSIQSKRNVALNQSLIVKASVAGSAAAGAVISSSLSSSGQLDAQSLSEQGYDSNHDLSQRLSSCGSEAKKRHTRDVDSSLKAFPVEEALFEVCLAS